MSGRSSSLWSQLPQGCQAPPDRHKHACCSHGAHVYMLGGRGRHALRDFWRYNVARDEWTELDCSSPAAPEELEEHSMVAYQGFIYVFGGRIASAYTDWNSSLWVFDIEKESWVHWKARMTSSQSQMPVNRKGHSAVVFGPAMFIYGGLIDMRGSSQEFWSLSFDTMLWSKLENGPGGPGPRHSHSAMTHLDCMYLYGGLKGLREQRDFWRWNSNSHTWTALKTSGPSRLLGHSAVAYQDSMLLFGGGESGGSPKNCLWRYSFTTHTWERLAVLPTSSAPPSRIHHCCVGLGPSYQARATSSQALCYSLGDSTNSLQDSGSRLRPFKNKCYPASSSCQELAGAIELETFTTVGDRREERDHPSSVSLSPGKETQRQSKCLTFENQFKDWDSSSTEDPDEESVARHLPDLLLVLGGKPLGGLLDAISVWHMIFTNH